MDFHTVDDTSSSDDEQFLVNSRNFEEPKSISVFFGLNNVRASRCIPEGKVEKLLLFYLMRYKTNHLMRLILL